MTQHPNTAFVDADYLVYRVGFKSDDVSAEIACSRLQEMLFDAVFVDETHHIKKFDSEYARILGSLMCKVRIGLTATPNTKLEEQLTTEAFLGVFLAGLFVFTLARKYSAR